MNPWWWVALAIALGAGEMLTTTTLLLWSALAALGTAVVFWASGPAGWPVQVATFAVLSILITVAGRLVLARRRPAIAGSSLNRRAEQLVGRDGEVLAFDGIEGRIVIDGVPWRARLEGALPMPAVGDRVRIVAAEGIVVVVRPL
ncbi:MAG: NfeD family protein [Amaricoccus sp.]|uniref:NfeD family protein n=1 Tax=Amaricoccus sp. TaxID=1872485 RepID=UPI0039E3BE4C